jgi:hypothetical protein
MVTDPPYGVNYDPAWRNQAGRSINGTTRRMATGTVIKPIGARAVGKVVNDDRADWREAWAPFLGSVAYIWHVGTTADIVQDSLRPCLCNLLSTAYRHLMLSERCNGPQVALCAKCPGIPDCTPRAALGGARAEPSPSRHCSGHSSLLSGPKFPRQVKKPLSAVRRHKDGDPAQPAIVHGLGGWWVAVHRTSALSC